MAAASGELQKESLSLIDNLRAAAPRGARILVVEDDLFSQKLFKHIIQASYPLAEIVIAGDFNSALQTCASAAPFDLVILDVFLGKGKTGAELYDAVIKESPNSLVLMTSVLDPKRFADMIGKDRELPPFLQKPFHPDVCRLLIENLLNGAVK